MYFQQPLDLAAAEGIDNLAVAAVSEEQPLVTAELHSWRQKQQRPRSSKIQKEDWYELIWLISEMDWNGWLSGCLFATNQKLMTHRDSDGSNVLNPEIASGWNELHLKRS